MDKIKNEEIPEFKFWDDVAIVWLPFYKEATWIILDRMSVSEIRSEKTYEVELRSYADTTITRRFKESNLDFDE